MKIVRFFLPFVLLAYSLPAHSYPQRVFIEDFTSATCPPCAPEIPYIDALLDQYTRDEVVGITFHMNWPAPGNDPYYMDNPSQNTTRRSYYGVNSIPMFFIDGLINSYRPSQPTFGTTVAGRLGRETPFLIEVNPIYSGNTLTAEVSVTSDEPTPAGLRLYIALVEKHGEISPSWVAHEFRYSMLQMLPTASGVEVNSEGGSEVLEFSETFTLEEGWSPINLAFVCWLQVQSSQEVVQAAYGEVPTDVPNLNVVQVEVIDSDQAIPNGRPDVGETTQLQITLSNSLEFQPTNNLVATLSCDDESLVIEDASGAWPTIEAGEQADNGEDLFTIAVPEDITARHVTFTLHFSDDSGYETELQFLQLVGTPNVALVNDFGGGWDVSGHWFDIFQAAGFAAQEYAVSEALESDLTDYEYVIWATSNSEGDVLDEEDIASISNYVDAGGKLILTGENIGEDEAGEEWFQSRFAAQHRLDAPPAASRVRVLGLPNGPFPEMDLVLVNGAGNSLMPSTITPLEGSVSFFKYIGTTEIAGVGFRTDEINTIYLAFNIEATSGMNETTTAAEALLDLMAWLDGTTSVGSEGEAALPETITLGAWPNPFNAAVTINYSVPTARNVRLSVFNLLGQQVATLHDGFTAVGHHKATWNASDQTSGIYLLRLESGMGSRTEKLLLVK